MPCTMLLCLHFAYEQNNMRLLVRFAIRHFTKKNCKHFWKYRTFFIFSCSGELEMNRLWCHKGHRYRFRIFSGMSWFAFQSMPNSSSLHSLSQGNQHQLLTPADHASLLTCTPPPSPPQYSPSLPACSFPVHDTPARFFGLTCPSKRNSWVLCNKKILL